MGILPHNDILKLRAAIVSAQLVASRSALLVGIDQLFVAGLPTAANPSDQILSDVGAMNNAGTLADGSVPLAIWLQNALARAGGKKEAEVFAPALAQCEAAARGEQADPACPFPGLEFFDEDRAGDFFGRETEIEEALAQLREARPPRRWLQIDGPSGAGKSSFARAGIVPVVRAGRLVGGPKNWVTAVMRPGHDPVLSLAEALVKGAKPPLDVGGRDLDDIRTKLAGSTTALASLLREGRPEGHGVLLLVDQLEEAFTLARADEGALKQFDALLADALDDRDGPLLLVTTIRSDFVARMAELPGLEGKLPTQAVRYYLRAMGEAGLRAAIEKPAQRAGLAHEEGLIDRIVGEARSSPGALPLVAHLLEGLYGRRDGRTMTLRAYEQLGGVGGALAKRADAIVDGFDEEGRVRARRLLLRLVKIGRGSEDTRQAASRGDLLGAAGGGPEAEKTLARLSGGRTVGLGGKTASSGRLVVVNGDVGKERVDLVHEALIQRWDSLRAWIREERQTLELRDDVEEAARIWEVSGAHEDGLPKGGTLGRFRGVDRAALREEARRYLGAAEEAEQRAERERRTREEDKRRAAEKQARFQRRVIVGLVGFVVALVGALTGVAWQAKKARMEEARARTAEQEAKVAQLAEREQREKAVTGLRAEKGARAAILAARGGWEIEALLLSLDAATKDGAFDPIDLPAPVFEGLSAAVFAGRRSFPLRGSTGAVLSAAISPDGLRVITASNDGIARLWDTRDRKVLATLKGHSPSSLKAVFSPDGARVATASADRTARLWDATTGAHLATLEGHKGTVVSVVFSPDSTRVVTASEDHDARLWDAKSGNPLAILRGHTERIESVAFSPDGARIVTGSDDDTMRYWEGHDGELILTVRCNGLGVNSVAFSLDGGRIVTGNGDNAARIWDARKGTLIATLGDHVNQVLTAVFSPDGGRIVTGSYISGDDTDTARLWSATDGKLLARLPTPLDASDSAGVWVSAFSPDGTKIITAGANDSVRIWDAQHGTLLTTLQGHSGWIYGGMFSTDGGRIVTASADGTARLWEVRGESEALFTLNGHSDEVSKAAFSPDDKLVVTGSVDTTARLWDAHTGKSLVTLDHHYGRVWDAAFSPDGRRLVIHSRIAQMWSVPDGALLFMLPGAADSVSFSPDGRVLITTDSWGPFDHDAHLLDASDGKLLATLRGHSSGVGHAAFSPDGALVVTTSADATARLWRVPDGSLLATLEGHTGGLTAAAFSPDGARVITAGRDNTARLWNAADGTSRAVLKGHADDVLTAQFSHDGMRVVTASSDYTARLWNAIDGAAVATLRGHSGRVRSATFSSDGLRVLTGSTDGTARLWDGSSGKPLATLIGCMGVLNSAEFSSDGRYVVTACADGKARIYPATSEGFLILACQLVRWQPMYGDVKAACDPYLDRSP